VIPVSVSHVQQAMLLHHWARPFPLCSEADRCKQGLQLGSNTSANVSNRTGTHDLELNLEGKGRETIDSSLQKKPAIRRSRTLTRFHSIILDTYKRCERDSITILTSSLLPMILRYSWEPGRGDGFAFAHSAGQWSHAG
jgi:hypothetical protein